MSDHRSNGAGGNGGGPSPSDAEIVRRVVDGDRDGYGLLIRRYQESLHRFAVGMVGDEDAAADLVQDSFVRAYTSLEDCRSPSKFEAWIYQILRNRCRDFLKNLRRDHESLADHPRLVSRMSGPARELERSELRRTLRSALEKLPSSHREAFLLKHLHGHTYREISELVDASVSAVKMRVHRSREELRARVSRLSRVEGDVTTAGPDSSSTVEAAGTSTRSREDGP